MRAVLLRLRPEWLGLSNLADSVIGLMRFVRCYAKARSQFVKLFVLDPVNHRGLETPSENRCGLLAVDGRARHSDLAP